MVCLLLFFPLTTTDLSNQCCDLNITLVNVLKALMNGSKLKMKGGRLISAKIIKPPTLTPVPTPMLSHCNLRIHVLIGKNKLIFLII